jgi:undecaprenyl-diphosphatase
VTVDFSLLHHFNHFLAVHDGVEDPLTFYVGVSEILFVALLAAAFLIAGDGRRERSRAAVLAAAATPLALVLAQVVSRLVDRPRPFVDHAGQVHLFAKHAADAGFPSDHATASFAIATALVLYNRRWGSVALAFAALLAAGRVGIGVHYPTDVLAGAALGAGTTGLVWLLARSRLEAVADWAGARRDSVYARRLGTRPA